MAKLASAKGKLGGSSSGGGSSTGILTEKTFVKFTGQISGYFDSLKINNKKMMEADRRKSLALERSARRTGAPEKIGEDSGEKEEQKGFMDFLKNGLGKMLMKAVSIIKTVIAAVSAFIPVALAVVSTAIKGLIGLMRLGPIGLAITAIGGIAYFWKDIQAAFSGKSKGSSQPPKPTEQKEGERTAGDSAAKTSTAGGEEAPQGSSAPAAAATPAPAAAATPAAAPSAASAPPPATPAPPAAPAQAAPASPPPAPAAASAPPPAAAPAAEPAPKPKAEEQGKPEKVASPKERAKKEFGALDKGQALANQVGKIDDELEKLKEQADNIENDDDPKKVALMKRIEELENKRDNVSKQQDSLDKPDKFDKFAAKKTKGDRAFDEDAKGKPDRIDKALDDDGEIRKPKIPAGAPTKVTQTTTKESEETTTGGGSTLSSRVSDKPSEEYLAAEKKYKDALAELKAARKIKAPKDKIKELMNKVSEYRKAKSKLKPKTRMATSTTPSELKSNKTKSSDTTVIIKPVVKKKVVSDW